MRFNSFSYVPTPAQQQLSELHQLGFGLSATLSDKQNLENFVRRAFFLAGNTDFALGQWLADEQTDLLTFFQSDRELTTEVFYQVAFQLLGFVPFVDYTDVTAFRDETGFPIAYGNLIDKLYQLLTLRTKTGNTLIDQLVSGGLIPEDNAYHFFNGKALATFDTKDTIREVVYVEAPVDTAGTGQTDLVKVSIIRPRFSGKIPAVITNSPYHQGINGKASDAALHDMKGELLVKKPSQLTVEETELTPLATDDRDLPVQEATESLGRTISYSLNEYFLARGFANLHISGVGTLGSTGIMTSGDAQQVAGFAAVIDWLNGRAKAYTDHTRTAQVVANWANGKVATTGLSYLGTLSNALATTGIDGLEVIIAEAGISSWYDYYRENGLVMSPGGYPGEDLDSLTALTYSRSLQAGDFLRQKATYETAFATERQALDRATGNYNQYWHDRNYLRHTNKVKATVVLTHGSQDWNVKPIHAWNFYRALPETVDKHLFFHNGAHVYMNNWQSIDFRESMNALLSQKLLGNDTDYSLPPVIWQDNTAEQTWMTLDHFGSEQTRTFALGQDLQTIQQHYDEETFERYAKSYPVFHQDLFDGKANQVTIDIPVDQALHINGRAKLLLRVASSVEKGLLSAQLLDQGSKKRLTPIPAPKERLSVDNGRYHAQENLTELPFVETPQRVLTKGHLNLQHRTDRMVIEPVVPGEWMTLEWELQPTIYKLDSGDTLRLILYTTDFETTIRDNSDWTITVDLSQSQLVLPVEK